VNYDQPRELTTGGWHYTSRNDDRIFPVGYCYTEHRDQPHATEDEARRCYARYLLNERTLLDGTLDSYNPCEAPSGCATLTNRCAVIDGWPHWRLCDEHRTEEIVAELQGELAGDSIHS
jgi:hypothetical protein